MAYPIIAREVGTGNPGFELGVFRVCRAASATPHQRQGDRLHVPPGSVRVEAFTEATS